MELGQLRDRYRGQRARNYDRDRIGSAEWEREQEVVESFLRDARPRSNDLVLDIPVGTGRFLELYKSLGCRAAGLDISEEMLEQAVVRAADLELDAELGIGDITSIAADDSSATVVICVRILNLLGFNDFRRALAEASRVSSEYVIAGIQVRSTPTKERAPRLGPALRGLLRKSPKKKKKKVRSTEPHPEASVLREFRKRQLTVVRQELVVESKSAAYYLYLLRKSK